MDKKDPRTNQPSKENGNNLPNEEACASFSECIEHKEEDIKLRYEGKYYFYNNNVFLHIYEELPISCDSI